MATVDPAPPSLTPGAVYSPTLESATDVHRHGQHQDYRSVDPNIQPHKVETRNEALDHLALNEQFSRVVRGYYPLIHDPFQSQASSFDLGYGSMGGMLPIPAHDDINTQYTSSSLDDDMISPSPYTTHSHDDASTRYTTPGHDVAHNTQYATAAAPHHDADHEIEFEMNTDMGMVWKEKTQPESPSAQQRSSFTSPRRSSSSSPPRSLRMSQRKQYGNVVASETAQQRASNPEQLYGCAMGEQHTGTKRRHSDLSDVVEGLTNLDDRLQASTNEQIRRLNSTKD